MHVVQQLAEAIAIARSLGITIREECLDGYSGGLCEIKGKKWLFLEIMLSPLEQLDVVVDALHNEAGLAKLEISAPLVERLNVRKAA